jgi:O-antigen ligase
VDYLGSSSVALGVPLALAAGLRLVSTGRLRPLSGALLALSTFVAWAAASVLWAHETTDAIRSARTYVQLLASVWLSWQLLRTEKDVHALLGGFLVGCAATAVAAWRAFSMGQSWGDTWEGQARYAASGYDPNDMAVMAAFGIPVAVYLAVVGRRHFRLALAYLPIAVSAIALSSSRGGSITAGVALASVMPWVARRSRAMLVAMLVGGAAGIAIVLLRVPADSWLRLFTIREQIVSGSVGDRGQLWRIGLDIFAEHPVAGVGASGYGWAAYPLVGILTVAHNTPIEVAADFGAVGLFLFVATVALLVRGLWRTAADQRAFGLALMLVWFVGTTSLSWAARKGTWFVFLVSAALAALPRRRRDSRGART